MERAVVQMHMAYPSGGLRRSGALDLYALMRSSDEDSGAPLGSSLAGENAVGDKEADSSDAERTLDQDAERTLDQEAGDDQRRMDHVPRVGSRATVVVA